jgi:methenyltetrahydromethanopterin cyclohydrolase
MSENFSASQICHAASQAMQGLRIATHRAEGGGRVIDFGCRTPGGFQAGIILARICMAGMGDISIHPTNPSLGPWPIVQVVTDHPARACMGAQYAGWKISVGEFFAMGSGPMRAKRGGEAVLDRLAIFDSASEAVGVLECDALPGPEVIAYVAQECRTKPEHVTLCAAPTRSIAGVIQVVARSIETALHKLFESGFDLTCVISGHGTAPLPPIAKDFAEGIGRTNDAILYGGHVTLWVDASDDEIRAIGPTIPSLGSRDYGKPFAITFKEYNYDFYQVDPGLFAPAMVTLVNQRSGNAFRFGAFNPTLLETSFGEAFD